MKKKTVKVRKERHYRPHAEFFHAAHVHLEHVKERQRGFYYSLLSAFLMTAFTLEAYLNYVGPIVERGWEDFDKATPLAKLRHVACVVGVPIDSSSRPMQSIIELFTFRNRMAHPRAMHIVEEHLSTPEEYQKDFYSEPRPDWMAFATENNALRCHRDVGAIIEAINSKLPVPDAFPLMDMPWSGLASAHEQNT
jgi:hypothetical protein